MGVLQIRQRWERLAQPFHFRFAPSPELVPQSSGAVLIIQVGGWKGERLLGLLCAAGYDARVVDERDAALEILKGEHPILLVVDGAADLNLYRALRAASIVPILVLAPESDQDLVTTALDAGVDDYQAGPISNREIIARVHAIVRSARRKSFGEFVVRA